MRLILNLTASLMILAAAAAQAQAADPYQWVGFTSQDFDGVGNGFGFTLMTAQCRVDFGPGARMCKSSEYMDSDTLNPSGIPVEGAWIRPSWRGLYGADPQALDESGWSGNTRDLSCSGWSFTNASRRGLGG